MARRILVFSTAYFPYISGAELAVQEIAERLRGEFEFDLITARLDAKSPSVERAGPITVYRVGWGSPRLAKLYLAFFGHRLGMKLHRKNAYHATWAIMASFGGFAAAAFKAASGVPLVLTLQEGDDLAYIARRTRWVRGRFRRIFTSADALQSISKFLQRWGREMGFRGSVDEVIPNGVDIGAFTRQLPAEEVAAARRSFGFPEQSKIVITTSRLTLKNGVEDVIRSLPLLPESVCFCVCGVGELASHLEAVVAELGLQSRVRFLGFRQYRDLPPLLHASDVFIRPSLSEGLGNSFLEAMAAGLITIGTPVGGIPDFLEDGVTGLLCRPSDPASVAEAIGRALAMPEQERTEMQRRALEVVRSGYDWDTVSRRMGDLLRRVAS